MVLVPYECDKNGIFHKINIIYEDKSSLLTGRINPDAEIIIEYKKGGNSNLITLTKAQCCLGKDCLTIPKQIAEEYNLPYFEVIVKNSHLYSTQEREEIKKYAIRKILSSIIFNPDFETDKFYIRERKNYKEGKNGR